MTTASVQVQLADAEMTDLVDHREHCWMDPDLAVHLGLAVGQQIRVIRNSDEYALYTVSALFEGGPADNRICMGLGGLQRLRTDHGFSGTVDTQVPHPTYTDTEAIAYSEFVERLIDPPGGPSHVVACAAHAGSIERYTDQQAEAMGDATALAPYTPVVWSCRGWRANGGAFTRWHITSTDISPVSFPLLGTIASRGFRYAVSFHGMSGSGKVLVGGAASRLLKIRAKAALDAVLPAHYKIEIPTGGLDGSDPANFVNWLTASGVGGIQLEQTMDARRDFGIDIARAMADLLGSLL